MKTWTTTINGQPVDITLKNRENWKLDYELRVSGADLDTLCVAVAESPEAAYAELVDQMRSSITEHEEEASDLLQESWDVQLVADNLSEARAFLVEQWAQTDFAEAPAPEYDYTDQLDLIEALEES